MCGVIIDGNVSHFCEICAAVLNNDQQDYRFTTPVCLSCGDDYDKLNRDLAEQEETGCEQCRSVVVTFGGLKNAQNEAFQEGIKFALKMTADYRIAELSDKKFELYDEPVCVCGNK